VYTVDYQPIFPEPGSIANVHATGSLDIDEAANTSNLDDKLNTLSRVAHKYGQETWLAVRVDVIYFHPHLLHRSHPNVSQTRWRRSLVCRYCNARSWVLWNHGAPWEGDAANYLHILARGATHLPHAQPNLARHVWRWSRASTPAD
jgi:phytanoyl-CoA hydroxylase